MPPTFTFTVRQLTGYIKTLLERDRALHDLAVEGELSNFLRHSSGHCYFTLKDEATQLRCVLFREQARRLSFAPEDGMHVVALGGITVYERGGQYQLIVEELRLHGAGALWQAFEALKRKLAAEGLFEAARKRPLPAFPRHVALLTSADGAVFHDFVSIVRRRWPAMTITLIPIAVQGARAVPTIVAGLGQLGQIPVDVAVLARGGGSIEELWAFNEEAVARAIAACPVPVVSAIGHETDFTIADFVADLRAPTPSAAAELVAPNLAEWEARPVALLARGREALTRRVQFARQRFDHLGSRPVLRTPLGMLTPHRQRLDELTAGLSHATSRLLHTRRERLAGLHGKLAALDPRACLGRGYSMVRRVADGSLVMRIAQVAPGDQAEVVLADGSFISQVETVRPDPGSTP
jgi:exodeoxyribonuclease VII large subunit